MTDLEREADLAQARAAAALARAVRAGQRAERFDTLARTGPELVRELHQHLADAERRTADRHRVSAGIHKAFARRARAYAAVNDSLNIAQLVAEASALTSAAVTLFDDDHLPLASVATDPIAKAAQDAELVIGEGPAFDVVAGRGRLSARVAASSRRWPVYADAVERLGVRSVAAVPLVCGELAFGVLTVFDADSEVDSGRDGPTADLERLTIVGEALPLAVVTAVLAASEAGSGDPAAVLGESIAVLHRASGIVAIAEGCDTGSALALIRAQAFVDGVSGLELARDIVRNGGWPG